MAFIRSFYQQKEALALPFLLLGGAALALLPLRAVSAAIVGGGVFLLSLVNPVFSLYFLAFSVPFGTVGKIAIGPLAATVTEILVAVLLVSWLAAAMARKTIRIHVVPFLWPLLIYLIVLTVSMTIAPSLSLGLKELIKWTELLVVLIIAANLLRPGPWANFLVWSLLAAGLAEALYGWYQFFTRSGPEGFIIGGSFMRAYGTFGQPNPFGGYMATVLGFLTGLILGRYREWQSSRAFGERSTPWTKFFGINLGIKPQEGAFPWLALFAGALFILGAMLMSLSRGAWLGYLSAVVVTAVFFNRKLLPLLLLGWVGIVLLLFLGALELLPQAIASRLGVLVPAFWAVDLNELVVTPQNFPLVQRMVIWQAAWEMFKTSPIIGVGIGNFDKFYPQYALPSWQELPGHAHNYYLNLLAETGVTGLAAYLLFIGTAFGYAIRTFIKAERSAPSELGDVGYHLSSGPVALGAIGALTVLSVHNLFDNLYVHGMTVQIGLILGLMGALAGAKPPGSGRSES